MRNLNVLTWQEEWKGSLTATDWLLWDVEFPLWPRHLGGSDKQGGEMVPYNDGQINWDTAKTPRCDNGGCKHGTKSFLPLRQNTKLDPQLQQDQQNVNITARNNRNCSTGWRREKIQERRH